MIRAVLDANVLAAGIAGARLPSSVPGELIRRWQSKDLSVVTSDHILREVELTLAKPYFVRRLPAEAIDGAMRLLRARTELVNITVEVKGVATHAEDDLVIATAVSGRVPYLVTGDGELQGLGRHRGVTILSPARLVAVVSVLK